MFPRMLAVIFTLIFSPQKKTLLTMCSHFSLYPHFKSNSNFLFNFKWVLIETHKPGEKYG